VLQELDAVVVGISPDSVESHARFRKKNDLNFTLVSDEDGTIAKQYGAWKERSLIVTTVGHVDRSTFIVGEDGTVLEAWRNVSVRGHAQRILEALGG
jgi:peroxiredoxin Q/BCP